MRNPVVGICWLSDTNFDVSDAQPLFDDNVCPVSTIEQGGEYFTTTKIILQSLKISEHTHRILEVDI